MDELIIQDEREMLRTENEQLRQQLDDALRQRERLEKSVQHLRENQRIDAEILLVRAEKAENELAAARKHHKQQIDKLLSDARWHNAMGALFAALGGFLVAGIILAARIAGMN